MDRLCIGSKSQRKRRHQKIVKWAWIASLTASAAGAPVASTSLDWLTGLEPSGAEGDGPQQGIETSESAAEMMRFRAVDFPEPRSAQEREQQAAPEAAEAPQEAEAPEPAAEPEPAAPAGSITGIVYSAAAEFGLDGGYLLSVAECESGLDPSAVSPAGYYGLFQFDETTWGAYGYGSIYDPTAQARTAAELIAQGEAERWPNCA